MAKKKENGKPKKDTDAFGYDEGESGGTWLSGVATFKFNDDETKVKATVTNYKGKEEKVTFSADLLPDVPKAISESEKYGVSIRLDEDGDVEEVESIYPASWMGEIMKPVDVSRDEDELPAPIELSFEKGGKTIDYKKWIVFLEFTKGEFKGSRIAYWLNYSFKEREDGMTQFSGNPNNPKATRLRELRDFCLVTDCISDDIEWAEDGNILPELWARIESKGNLLLTSGKDANVDTVLPYEVEDDEEPEEKPKKKGKKVKEEPEDDDDDF